MTVKDWNNLELPVVWCIYESDEINYPQELEVGKSYKQSDFICPHCGIKGQDCDCHDNRILDLTTPVPDGVYDVLYFRDKSKSMLVNGITVQDGKFVPEPTAKAIYTVVLFNYARYYDFGDPVDHCFVEYIEWNGTHFVVVMGS